MTNEFLSKYKSFYIYIYEKEELLFCIKMADGNGTHIFKIVYDKYNDKPEELLKLLDGVQRRREYNKMYRDKHKNDPERREKHAAASREWQRKNREHLAEKHNTRYKNDEEYRQRLRDFRKEYYYQAKERAKRPDQANDTDSGTTSDNISCKASQ